MQEYKEMKQVPKKLNDWVLLHDPSPIHECVASISTGIVCNEKITCHKANELGNLCISKIIGNNLDNLIFERKNSMLPFKCMTSKITMHDKVIPINIETIFRRIAFHRKSSEELQHYFEYELAPYSPSLFDDIGMRKKQKSVF